MLLVPKSLQSLQRRDAVVFLKLGRFGSDLCRIKLDLFRIFFGLDLDETFDWMFYRFRQIVQRFDSSAVHLRYGQISKVIVADCAVGRQDLAEDHDAPIPLWKQLRLEMVEINQALRRFSLPVRSPFLEILTG